MQGRRKWMQKTLALITVIMLLVMMLPAAAFAAGNGNGKGNSFGQARAAQAHEANANRVKGEDDPEDLEDPEDPEDPEDMEDPEETEDPEEMSEWAIYVHARNDWAKDMGLAPGHANLLDKLLAATTDPEAEVVEPSLDPEAELLLMAPLQALYDEMFSTKPFSVQEVIKAIKTARIEAREAEATLEAVA